MSIYVEATLSFRLEVEVEHIGSSVYVSVVEVDSDGGLYHYPKDIEDQGEMMATFTAAEVAGLSDQEVADKAARLVE